ncbi:TIGR00341 family protein [Patescibacteria group bacterium]|nr:TIGR00341 family protein [Patescibacteria group bacterium]
MLNIFHHRESSLLEATRKERQEAIENLISQGTLRSGYYLMLMLATLIVTPGLLLDNVSIIIGGMILAPLIVPILSLSLALVSGNVRGMVRSVGILTLSILLVFTTSLIMTVVLSQTYTEPTHFISDQIRPGIFVFIAFCSGIAGAFSFVKKNLSQAIAGVAVSVSLLPPICAAGIGMALKKYSLMNNSLILLGANFVGICMAAFIVFWILGFLDSGRAEEKAIEKEGKE